MACGKSRNAISNLRHFGIEKSVADSMEWTLRTLLKQYGLLCADYNNVNIVSRVETMLKSNHNQFPPEFRNRYGSDRAIRILYRRCKGISKDAREAAYTTQSKPRSYTRHPAQREDNTENDEVEINCNKRKCGMDGFLHGWSLLVVDMANPSVTSCCRMVDICHGGDISSADQISYRKLMDILERDFRDTATDIHAHRIVYYLKTGSRVTIRNSRQLCAVLQIACYDPMLSNAITIFLELKEPRRDEKFVPPITPAAPAGGPGRMVQPQQQHRTTLSEIVVSNVRKTPPPAFTLLPATTSPWTTSYQQEQRTALSSVWPLNESSALAPTFPSRRYDSYIATWPAQHERQYPIPDGSGSNAPGTRASASPSPQSEFDDPTLLAPLRQQSHNNVPSTAPQSPSQTFRTASGTHMAASAISIAAKQLRPVRSTTNRFALHEVTNQPQLGAKRVVSEKDLRLAETQQQQHRDTGSSASMDISEPEATDCSQQ